MITAVSFVAINFQTASKEQLMTIKGIDEQKASAIIKYRMSNNIKSASDLEKVPETRKEPQYNKTGYDKMNFNDILSLKENGFKGFKTIEDLWSDSSIIPKEKGIYLILNPKANNMDFINPGVGGFFKGKNPNVSINELMTNFIKGSLIVYIGKAGSSDSEATLKSRLKQYLKFGQGKRAGHRGGRYIWQIKHYKELLVCWKIMDKKEPRDIERLLIAKYKQKYERLPFANLRH